MCLFAHKRSFCFSKWVVHTFQVCQVDLRGEKCVRMLCCLIYGFIWRYLLIHTFFVVFALQEHLFVAHLPEHSQILSSSTTGHAGWVNLQYLWLQWILCSLVDYHYGTLKQVTSVLWVTFVLNLTLLSLK